MIKVYMDMSGDLFHFGHVNALKAAASHGDYLLVGVHGDKTIESYKRLPIMTMDERISVIESCKYVNEIIRDAPLRITEKFMKDHEIDKVCIVDNRSNEQNELMYNIPISLNKIVIFPYTNEISTTDIINRILSRH